MSTNEEKLQKLKVAELKELLAAHHLVQTGKKDELVKRLVENNISADGEASGAAQEEELLGAPVDAPEPAADSEAAPAESAPTTDAPPNAETPAPTELTPEQQALKARAERFGLPFDPSALSAKAAAPKSSGNGSTAAPSAALQTAEKKEKAGPIDKTSLGLSDEVLAKRAAKFGLPEKKAVPEQSKEAKGKGQEQKKKEEQNGAGAKGPTAGALKTADPEITPEMAEKIAAEEEKRRKRAEKFGTAAAPSTTAGEASGAGEKHAADGSSGEPDAKKAKV